VTQAVGVQHATPQVLKKVTFNAADGSVKLNFVGNDAKPVRAWTETHRPRKKGEKTMMRIDIDPDDLRIGESTALRKFDFIFAIDTNTSKGGATKTSVAHVMQMRFVDDDCYQEASLKAFVFTGVEVKQENLAWQFLIDGILKSPDHKPSNKYAIITDSDLGDHPEFNRRKKPFYADVFLPDNFDVVYPSADGGHNIANQLIRQCDRMATDTLNKIKAGAISITCEPYAPPATNRNVFHIFNATEGFEAAGWFRLQSKF
jgi:hypothetical protein